jgi:transcriptional regulator with XRE-family HTH domain
MAYTNANTAVPAKIGRLFAVMHRRGEPELSNQLAAEGITATTGVDISAEYLQQLRCGEISNPSASHLRAIAEYFGVPADYLITDLPDMERQLSMLKILRDAGVRDLNSCTVVCDGRT